MSPGNIPGGVYQGANRLDAREVGYDSRMRTEDPVEAGPTSADPTEPAQSEPVRLVRVHDLRAEGYDGTCLRPLGLCELGGACDVCWYRPDHPRFKR